MARTLGDLESLIAGIHRRAGQHAIEADAEADRRAADIRAEAEARRAQAVEAIATRFHAEQRQSMRRRRAQGALDARRLTIVAREALIDRVWREAEARLRRLVESDEYPVVLERLAALAARELGEPRVELAADARGHELLTPARLEAWSRAAGVELAAAPSPSSAWGGLVARAGRKQYDATFATGLETARDRLRGEVLDRLGWEAP